MRQAWVYSLGRCLNEGCLHVVRFRNPEVPRPEPTHPQGVVGIGSTQVTNVPAPASRPERKRDPYRMTLAAHLRETGRTRHEEA